MKARNKRAPAPKATAIPQPAPIGIRSRHLLAAAALCLLTLLAFSNSFNTGFPLDNKGLILQDARIREATSQNIDLILQHSYWWPRGNSGLYRPVTTLSYLFNYAILGDGDHPAGYHWINFLLHLANVMLVYALALRVIGHFWPSALLAGLWAVHPVLTESVTNIVGRPDLLAGTALLGGFLLYLKSTESVGFPRIAWLVGLLVVTALGVFSKESAVMIVALIVLYEVTWWKERRLAMILGCVAVLVPLEALLYQRSFVFATEPPVDFPFTDNPLVGAGFWQAKLTAIGILARYFGLALWPWKLSADYSYNQIPMARGSFEDWAAWILVAALAVGTMLLYRRNRTAFFWACFAFLALLPTTNLVFPLGAIMAERFLYLPAIGLMACLVLAAYAAGQYFQSPKFAPIALGVLMCAFTIRTWARNADWQNELTLGRATVEASPRSFKSHQLLAEALYAADDSHSNVDAVLEEAERGLAILNPLPDSQNMAELYRLAGECYLIEGDRSSGAEVYRKARTVLERGAAILDAARKQQSGKLRSAPSPNDDLYRLLSMVYVRLGDGDKALEAALAGRKLSPLSVPIYSQLGQVLVAGGQPEDAATVLMEGMLVTSDMGLRQQLIDLYGKATGPNACAITTGPNGPAINPACGLVHRNLCEASLDAIRIRLETGRPDIARDLKKSSLNDYGCPAGPIDEALPDASGSK